MRSPELGHHERYLWITSRQVGQDVQVGRGGGRGAMHDYGQPTVVGRGAQYRLEQRRPPGGGVSSPMPGNPRPTTSRSTSRPTSADGALRACPGVLPTLQDRLAELDRRAAELATGTAPIRRTPADRPSRNTSS
ncbi:hypothetical protein [Nocardia sp. NPDC057030]|uniref:hypothetical protein n=1 Tax=unclassified Nocardia TaxID=2637762 RepID=UPI0036283B47